MARPRKDAELACARLRLIDAFWELLAHRSVQDITIGALTAAAGCNRATFYYHFEDMGALVDEAVRAEIDSGGLVAPEVFSAFAGGEADALRRRVPATQLRRLCLVIRAGMFPVFERAVRDSVQEAWESRLCDAGEPLDPAATFAIQYMVGGMLGFAAWSVQGRRPRALAEAERAYLVDVARATVDAVARAQGMSSDEVIERIRS